MLGTKKILIVDDCVQDIYLLQNALRQCGIEQIESLTSGGDAAKYIAGLPPYQFSQPPDLMFVDIKMQGIDGFELIKWLFKNPIFRKIPIVVFSGSTNPEEKAKALEIGAKAFYEKPQENEDLVKLAEQILHDVFETA